MPLRDTAPDGAPCWIDLFSSELDRSRAFYGELFGWESEAGGEEYGGYVTFTRDGVAVAGAMTNDGSSGAPDGWTIYLSVPDIAATAEKVTANGGALQFDPMPVVDLGQMCVLTDVSGSHIGMWQPGTFGGFGVLAEPGSPGWFELHTREFAPTVKFYEDVFGWDTHVVDDSDEFRYTTLGEGEGQLAGVMDAAPFPPEAPTGWSIYFSTADTDASVKLVEELGGAVVTPPEDTPYGRLATCTDVTGATFKLVGGG